jgi:hypothetical protein
MQWLFYDSMLSLEEKEEFDRQLLFAEYIAWFWAPEAVKKIKQIRKDKEKHAFMDDKEFTEHVESGDYKNNPLIKLLQEMRKADGNNTNSSNTNLSKEKSPTDLKRLIDVGKY